MHYRQTTNLFTYFIKIYVAYIDNYSIQILKINQKGIVKPKKFAIIDDINKAVIRYKLNAKIEKFLKLV